MPSRGTTLVLQLLTLRVLLALLMNDVHARQIQLRSGTSHLDPGHESEPVSRDTTICLAGISGEPHQQMRAGSSAFQQCHHCLCNRCLLRRQCCEL